ncbi:MAG: SpvB/TcaC N-terminal domain-containing protein [bacterium]|nr:SpvB/TcaC N-terminal domain-containing protein [bacterium]
MLLFSMLTASPLQAAGYDFDVASVSRQGVINPEHRHSSTDTATGTYTYSYPLNLPQGRRGMMPEITFDYSSQNASHTVLGYGWDVGIPSISRSSKYGVVEMYDDGRNDFYGSLFGELTPLSIDGDGYGIYGPKIETGSFYTIEYHPDDSWTVNDREGRIYTFGADTLSRSEDHADASRISKWMLNKVEDANGNMVTYTYEEDEDQMYPHEVYYTGKDADLGRFKIVFTREARPDILDAYNTGYRIETNQRISGIEIYDGLDLMREVDIAYTSGVNGMRSLVESFTETSHGPFGTVVLPPIEFNYTDAGTAWEFTEGEYNLASSRVDGDAKRFIDINGDSYIDFVFAWRNDWIDIVENWIHNGDETGWTEVEDIIVPEYLGGPSGAASSIVSADIDGDGDMDWMRAEPIAHDHDDAVYLNDGTGTWTEDLGYDFLYEIDPGRFLIDINGDGYSDIFKVAGETKQVFLHDADGTGWTWDISYEEGDHIPEDFDYINHHWFDVNGDGLTDGLEAWEVPNVYLNTGDKNWSNVSLTDFPAFINTIPDAKFRIVDVNGDGLEDIIDTQYEPFSVHINKGNYTWEEVFDWEIPFEYRDREYMLDVNADGHADFARTYEDTCTDEFGVDYDCWKMDSYVWNGQKADLLNHITFSSGSSIYIDYTVSSHERDISGNLLNPNLPFIQTVVDSVTENDGMGNLATTSYDYAGGEFYYQSHFDRKMAGFASVEVIDAFGNITKQYFHQGNETNSAMGESADTGNKVGRMYREEVYDNADNLFRTSIYDWEETLLPDGEENRYFVWNAGEVQMQYDGNLTHVDTASTNLYDLTNGNLLEVTNWGKVDASDDGTFIDILSDASKMIYEYVESDGFTALPWHEEFRDESAELLREKVYFYDDMLVTEASLGNITKVGERIKPGFSAGSIRYTEFDHDAYGNIIQEIDAENAYTVTVFDADGYYPTSMQNHYGHIQLQTVDTRTGEVTRMEDANGVSIETDRDAIGRPLEVRKSDPTAAGLLNTIETYTYDDISMPRSITKTTHDGTTTMASIEYIDGLKNTMQIRTERDDGDYAIIDSSYDTLRRPASTSAAYISAGSTFTIPDPLQPQTVTSYDALSRVTSVLDDVGEIVTNYDGYEKTVTDEKGKVHTYENDAYGRLIAVNEVFDVADYVTSYRYNLAGDLEEIIDAEGNIRTFEYDMLGRRTMADDLHHPSDIDFGSYTYLYDLVDNLTSMQIPSGEQIKYSYDKLRRVTKEEVIAPVPELIVNYKYDSAENGLGKLHWVNKASDGIGTFYAYNLAGDAKRRMVGIDGANYEFLYQYDRLGRQIGSLNPSGQQLVTSYDESGIETMTLDGVSVLTSVMYAPHGREEVISYGNGAVTVNTYDPFERYWLQNRVTTSGLDTVQSLTYGYDPAGNLTALIDASTLGTAHTVVYGYDDLHRLTSATATEYTEPADNYDWVYDYDILGNMILHPVKGVISYGETGHANPHAATGIGADVWAYDENGNLTSAALDSYTWNARGEMTSHVNGVDTTEYKYDDGGTRRVKVNPDGTRVLYLGDGFIIDESEETEEWHVSLNGNHIYTHINDLSPADEDRAHFIHTDHLTSIGAVTASDGTWLRVHTYTPYGNSHVTVENPADPSATDTDRFTFSGKERDDESDLMYFEARYLATDAARFTGQDMLFWDIGRQDRLLDPQLANSYSYTKNNPAVYVDPDGKNPLLALGGAASRFAQRIALHAAAGAIVGTGVQATIDATTPGKTSSGQYAGAALGGAVTGVGVGLGAGTMVPAAVGSVTGDLTGYASDGIAVSPQSIAQNALVSVVTGNIPAVSVKGVTAGRNSYSAISKQINTKLQNGTISTVSAATAGKSIAGMVTEQAPGAATEAAVKTFIKPIIKLFKKKEM